MKNSGFLSKYAYLIAALAGLLLFVPFIGNLHLFDWDEINFAECAREMIVSKDYLNVQIKFQPFWEKPPLFIWMQVLSMKVFGINEFAARLPNAIGGIVTLMTLIFIGEKTVSRRFGMWWAALYAASILPHVYFKSGIIDPWFNLFIFLSVFQFHRFILAKKNGKGIVPIALSGLFAGLAILTKGPVALLILGIVVFIYYLIITIREKSWQYFKDHFPNLKQIILFLVVLIVAGGFWFFLQIMNGHSDMVAKFINYQIRLFSTQDAGHGGNWTYHFIVLLTGVFPASVIAFAGFFKSKTDSGSLKAMHLLMLILFWTVLILFTIVKTKIVHYSSLCYYPLTFIAAYAVYHLEAGNKVWKKLYSVILITLSAIMAIIVNAIPLAMINKDKIMNSGMIKDDFAVANLQANVHWGGWEGFAGILLLAGTIVAVILIRKNITKGLTVLLASSLIFVQTVIYIFPYKIEKYTQGAVVEFFKSKKDEKCYVLTSGYHTYASHFYLQTEPSDYKKPIELLTHVNDRPFYLVLKEPVYKKWNYLLPAMDTLSTKNGWVFMEMKTIKTGTP